MKNTKRTWTTLLIAGLSLLIIFSCGKKNNKDVDPEDTKGDTYGTATADVAFESGETIDYKGVFKSKISLIGMGDPEDDDYKWRLAGVSFMVKGENKYVFGFTADIRGEGTYELHVTGQASLGSELTLEVTDKDEYIPLQGTVYQPIILLSNNEGKEGSSTLKITSLSDTHLKGTFSGVFYNKEGEKVTISNGIVDVDVKKN